MKKIIVLLIVLLAAGSFAFAEVTAAITGSASTTVGYDLDTSVFGWVNSASSDLTLEIGAAGENMGEGAWYGVITLSGAKATWDSANPAEYALIAYADEDRDVELTINELTDGTTDFIGVELPVALTAPSVTAKITNGDLYVQFASNPGFAANFVAAVDGDPSDGDLGDVDGGVEIGGSAPVAFTVSLGTNANYTDAAQVIDFLFGGTVAVDLAPAAIAAAVAVDYNNDASTFDAIFGVGLDVALDIVGIDFGFDGEYIGEAFTWETSVGISSTISILTVGLDVAYSEAMDADLGLSLSADLTPATVGLTFNLLDLTGGAMTWEADVTLALALDGGIAVAAGFGVDSASVIDANASVTLTELVDNVSFKLAWADGDDLTNSVLGNITFGATISY